MITPLQITRYFPTLVTSGKQISSRIFLVKYNHNTCGTLQNETPTFIAPLGY